MARLETQKATAYSLACDIEGLAAAPVDGVATTRSAGVGGERNSGESGAAWLADRRAEGGEEGPLPAPPREKPAPAKTSRSRSVFLEGVAPPLAEEVEEGTYSAGSALSR